MFPARVGKSRTRIPGVPLVRKIKPLHGKAQSAFETLKNYLISEPVLRHPISRNIFMSLVTLPGWNRRETVTYLKCMMEYITQSRTRVAYLPIPKSDNER